jgi:hypothetical protein
MKPFTLIVLVVLVLLSLPLVVYAQDESPPPTAEEDSPSEDEPISITDWLISILTVIVPWSGAVAIAFGTVKSQTLKKLWDLTPDRIETEEVRNAVYLIALAATSYLVTIESGFNVFDNAPADLVFVNSAWQEFWTATSLFVGAFLFHNAGQYFELRSLKRLLDDLKT